MDVRDGQRSARVENAGRKEVQANGQYLPPGANTYEEKVVLSLRKLLLTNNACYKAGRIITPKEIMVHSTVANNPNLRRYVGRDDGLLGNNPNNNHWNQDTPDGREVCVHAFIGKLADGAVATYQTLPWNHRGWHCGSGAKGSGNDSHISFEMCEDGLVDTAYWLENYTCTILPSRTKA